VRAAPTSSPKVICRLCDHTGLTRALTLPPTPPANDFLAEPAPQECFPLVVNVCAKCGHAQLGDVVDAESLFRDYVYVSGTSPIFRKHFERYATTVSERVRLKLGDLVCEIGSNDGTLLRCFCGARTLGVELRSSSAEHSQPAFALNMVRQNSFLQTT